MDNKIKGEIEIDLRITPGLKQEGIIREIIHQVQMMRKKAGYKPKHRILVRYFGTPELNRILTKNQALILKEIKAEQFSADLSVGTTALRAGKKEKRAFDIEKDLRINGEKLWLAIRKI